MRRATCAQILILLVALTAVSRADNPNGYDCGEGGTPNKKSRKCNCPDNKKSARDSEGIAICVRDPNAKYPVLINSAPEGAKVFLKTRSGAPAGVTPYVTELTVGDWQVFLEAPGYQLAQQTLQVTPGAPTLFVPLLPRNDPPTLLVSDKADGEVKGARVFLDDQLQDVAPTTITTTPGRHYVEVKKPNFESFQQWVTLKANDQQAISPKLTKSTPKTNELIVDSDISGASISIDEVPQSQSTPAVFQVSIGAHIIEVSWNGATVQKAVNIRPGAGNKIFAALRKGSISITSNIDHASVLVDGRLVGEVPIQVSDLPYGDHEIKIFADGYRSVIQKIVIDSKHETQTVNLNPLPPEQDHR